jgi:hypothetical protein
MGRKQGCHFENPRRYWRDGTACREAFYIEIDQHLTYVFEICGGDWRIGRISEMQGRTMVEERRA